MKAKKTKKQKHVKLKFFLIITIFTIIFLLTVKYYESKAMPTVKKAMEYYGINFATKIIDNSVKSVIEKSGLTSEDLYIRATDKNGKIVSFSADTVLINNLCLNISEAVVKEMEYIKNETVYLPIGIISGIDFLSAKGPEVLKIEFQPLGKCNVQYNTSFISEGINQVNYQIWIEVEASISIVNPLTEHSIAVVRKIPIVNTYISGDVPDSMLYPYNGIAAPK